jgi:hypothetical protein
MVSAARQRLWLGYVIVSVIVAVLYLAVPPFKGSGPLVNVVGLSSVLAILAGMRLHRPQATAAWWLFAAGQFLFFAGDLYTYGFPDVGFPSFGDGLYLAVYPALMAGLILLVRARNPEGDRSGVIDSLILTIGVALISWVTLIVPYGQASDLDLINNVVSVA